MGLRSGLAFLGVSLSVVCVAVGGSNPEEQRPAPLITEAEHRQAFEDFQRSYGKRYESPAEEEKRFAVFKDNSLFIKQQNELAAGSYTLGLNEFADMTWPEFQTGFVGYRPELKQKKWGKLAYLGQHVPERTASELPTSVDWSSKGAVTKVKNQGHCGSCWSFSTTGSLEGAWEIATGKLVSLSEQQFVDCAGGKYGNNGCKGGLMDHAFDYAEQNAICTEDSYPYEAVDDTCEAPSNCTVGIPKGGVVGYKDVEQENAAALMDAIAKGPVSVAIEADKQVFQFYQDGVLNTTCGKQLDHGVLAVGYGTWTDGTAYWKVKNSWGPNWGKEGFILLKRGSSSSASASTAGECGILEDPSYPVVNKDAPPAPPAPAPAPGPAPGPAPTPTPPATGSHYEKPPCRSDEVQAEVENAHGVLCAPPCQEETDCPKDTPKGVIAAPMCSLEDQDSGKKYCALMCTEDSDCQVGATCGKLDFLGVCVFPESRGRTRSSLSLVSLATKKPSASVEETTTILV